MSSCRLRSIHSVPAKSILTVCLAILSCSPYPANAVDAFVNGESLVVPVMRVGSQFFSATFRLVAATEPPQIELTDANELFDPETESSGHFDGSVLTIPRVNVADTVLWAELVLSSESPVRFTLLAADLVDITPPQACTPPPVPDPSHGDNNPQLVSGFLVPPSEILDGGPGPDGIPALTNPVFIHPNDAVIEPEDLVVGVKFGNHVRAYPHNILDWHEIVNITNGLPYTLSYCPLTGSAVAWRSFAESANKSFGTTGLLYNSNLVLYDRQSGSYWSQMLEQSISGPEVRRIPDRIQVIETSWRTWLTMYPDAPVLSMDTGFSRDYFEYPYFDFKTSSAVFFPVNNSEDRRLHAKERVVGINKGEASKVYPIAGFSDGVSLVNDRVGDMEVVAVGSSKQNFGVIFSRHVDDCTVLKFRSEKGRLPIVMSDNEGNEWDIFGNALSGPRKGSSLTKTNSYIAYWYAWTAFFPGADIHQ